MFSKYSVRLAKKTKVLEVYVGIPDKNSTKILALSCPLGKFRALFLYKFISILMRKNQCISVTDLRTKTKKCLERLPSNPRYVFVNNKPVAVLMDIDDYEELTHVELVELKEEEITPEIARMAEEARKTPRDQLYNL